jgi:hypothetical protein
MIPSQRYRALVRNGLGVHCSANFESYVRVLCNKLTISYRLNPNFFACDGEYKLERHE